MTNFDPYSRLIFLDNEYHVSQSPNQHKVLNPANLIMRARLHCALPKK